MAWQAAEPGLDRVHRLADGGEAAAVDDALHRADLLGGTRAALVPDRDRSRQIAERDMVTAQLLQRHVGVARLVVGVGIEELSRFVVEHLPQEGEDGLALGKPPAANTGQRLVGPALAAKTQNPP